MDHVIKRHRWQNISCLVCYMEQVCSILSLQESASQKELEEKQKMLEVDELQLLCKETSEAFRKEGRIDQATSN